MGKRSGVPDTDEALDALPIAQVEMELARVTSRQRIPGNSPHFKQANEKRLIWLTKYLARRKASEG